jgi:hypothetical protein
MAGNLLKMTVLGKAIGDCVQIVPPGVGKSGMSVFRMCRLPKDVLAQLQLGNHIIYEVQVDYRHNQLNVQLSDFGAAETHELWPFLQFVMSRPA